MQPTCRKKDRKKAPIDSTNLLAFRKTNSVKPIGALSQLANQIN
jgi:hypothetical protein